MSHEDMPSVGVIPNAADATPPDDGRPRSPAYPTSTDCEECAESTRAAYALCRDCLDSLPDELCPSCVLQALVR